MTGSSRDGARFAPKQEGDDSSSPAQDDGSEPAQDSGSEPPAKKQKKAAPKPLAQKRDEEMTALLLQLRGPL